MTVPTKASLNVKARLMSITGYNVLDCSSQQVTIVRQTGGKRRTIIKCEFWTISRLCLD